MITPWILVRLPGSPEGLAESVRSHSFKASGGWQAESFIIDSRWIGAYGGTGGGRGGRGVGYPRWPCVRWQEKREKKKTERATGCRLWPTRWDSSWSSLQALVRDVHCCPLLL